MGANETGSVLRRNLHLSTTERLIFDRFQGRWRVAFYRKRRPYDRGHELSSELHERLTRAGMLPQLQRSQWFRVAGAHSSLDGAIREVLRDQKTIRDVDTLIEYIHGTEWGKNL